MARPAVRRFQMLQQFCDRGVRKLGLSGKSTVFGGHSPDAAMDFVAVRMPETGLVMADNGIVPVAEIKGAIGTEFHIDGPKAAAARFYERRHVLEAEAGAIV